MNKRSPDGGGGDDGSGIWMEKIHRSNGIFFNFLFIKANEQWIVKYYIYAKNMRSPRRHRQRRQRQKMDERASDEKGHTKKTHTNAIDVG